MTLLAEASQKVAVAALAGPLLHAGIHLAIAEQKMLLERELAWCIKERGAFYSARVGCWDSIAQKFVVPSERQVVCAKGTKRFLLKARPPHTDEEITQGWEERSQAIDALKAALAAIA